MKGRLSAVLGVAALVVVTAAAAVRADDYFGNAARAARANNAEALRGLLAGEDAKPNDTDEEQRTALHYAAINGNGAIIAILVKAGAKLDAADRLGVVLPRRPRRIAEIIAGADGRGGGHNDQDREPEDG